MNYLPTSTPTHKPNVIPVTVTDVTPTTKLLPSDTHSTSRDVVTCLLTFCLCSIGLLGFMSYTLEYATNTVMEQRTTQQ
jgi:hypothetical protein